MFPITRTKMLACNLHMETAFLRTFSLFVTKRRRRTEEVCRLMGFRRSNGETRCSWQEASIRSRSKLLLLPFSSCTRCFYQEIFREPAYFLLTLTSKEIQLRIYFTFPLSKKRTHLAFNLLPVFLW